jgi:hypothetical protein
MGNPYTHIKDKKTLAIHVVKTREEAITKYRQWILDKPELINSLHELRGKRLGCYCHPKPCHGDVLIELINFIDTYGKGNIELLRDTFHEKL